MRPVGRAVAAEPPGEHDRQRDLVHLLGHPARHAVDPGVLPERAVRLLHAPQEVEQALGGGPVAGRGLRGGDVVEVARPDEVVGAGVGTVLERERAPHPRHARRRDRGPPVRLVLRRREHHQRLLVEAAHVLRAAHRLRRAAHRLAVSHPTVRVAASGGREAAAGGRLPRRGGVGPEADRQREVAPADAVELRLRRLHDVAGGGRVVLGVDVAVLEVGARVAGGARVAAGRAPERGRRADRRGHGVVGGHQRRRPREAEVVVAVVARRRVGEHEELQRPAGERVEADAGEDGRAARVGDPGRLEPPAGPAQHLAVGERAGDRLHGSAPHQPPPVGDHELQVAQARRREVGVVDLRQLGLPEREPDRAAELHGAAEALLVGGRPRVPLAGCARGRRLGASGGRPEGQQQRGCRKSSDRTRHRFKRAHQGLPGN